MLGVIPNQNPKANVVVDREGDGLPFLVPVIAWQVPEHGPLVPITVSGVQHGAKVEYVETAQ